MHALRWSWIPALLLTASGCRVDPVVPLLEQENTLLEDKIFQQQDELERCRQALEACREENAALRQQLLGTPIEPEIVVPNRPETTLPETGPGDSPPTGPAPPRDLGSSGTRQSDNTQAESIAVVPALSGGLDREPGPGDEGIAVVIQPRDRHGRVVPAPAPVSVVLLDPALRGEAARVARWDLDATEVARQTAASPIAGGLYLELAWPSKPPQHADLHLYARYTTDDGRKLQADAPIRINPPDPVARRQQPPIRPASARSAPDWRQKPARPPEQPAAPPATEPEGPPQPARTAPRPPRPTWSPHRS